MAGQDGRKIQVAQSITNGQPIRQLDSGEFGFRLDQTEEQLWIGSDTGNIEIITERNISTFGVADGSITMQKLSGDIQTTLSEVNDPQYIPVATQSSNGVMSSADKSKLDGINQVTVNNTLTSLSTTDALSAYQGKVLKDLIDSSSGGGGVNVVDNLTSTSTTDALSANQGRVLKGLVDTKAGTNTATTTQNGLMSASDKLKLDNMSGGGGVNVINNLNSTSIIDALSAYQGKVLNETKISGYQRNISKSATGTAIGEEARATGDNALAIGEYTKSTGYGSSSIGMGTEAVGEGSVSLGGYNKSTGDYSFALGIRNESRNYASTALGVNSTMSSTSGSATSFIATMDALVVGNGQNTSSRSNAFRVTFDGKVFGRQAYQSSGADYAEMFEWLDGNLNEEDRVGYFVTLDGDKIRKANSSDSYIAGIISANPSVLGDSASEGWNGQYVRDEFGRIQYHWINIDSENGDGDAEVVKEYHPILSEGYNPQAPYTPREERKEWDAVGMMGKLLVRDDGTAQVNGYVKPNDDGIATKTTANSNIKYRVMKRVSPNIIQVLVK